MEPSKRARTEDESVSSSTMANLPSHILMEILFRLPIKTVMVIRCVSKSLLNLVSDPFFAKLYSTRAPAELCVLNPDLDDSSSSTIFYIAAEPIYQDDSSIVVDMKFNLLFDLPRFGVGCKNDLNFKATKRTKLNWVNTCNGLVCCRGPDTNRFAVICNPVTGEYVTVPGPDRKNKAIHIWGTSYGFGFSPKCNMFKLLRLVPLSHDSGPVIGGKRAKMVGEVFAFGGSGSWKSVSNCPDVCPLGNPTFYGGVLHWYCGRSSDIVTFDFDTLQFGIMQTPLHFWDMEIKFTALTSWGVLGDGLYITGFVGDCVQVWMIKEYGVQCSWVKVFSIQNGAKNVSQNYTPIKYMEHEEMLMIHQDPRNFWEIACYNPDTGPVKIIGTCYPTCSAFSIRPSLVSLKVMLGDDVKAHSVKSWSADKKPIEATTVPPWWTNSVTKERLKREYEEMQERRKRQYEEYDELVQKHIQLMDDSTKCFQQFFKSKEVEPLYELIRQHGQLVKEKKQYFKEFCKSHDRREIKTSFDRMDMITNDVKRVIDRFMFLHVL